MACLGLELLPLPLELQVAPGAGAAARVGPSRCPGGLALEPFRLACNRGPGQSRPGGHQGILLPIVGTPFRCSHTCHCVCTNYSCW
jgi:hypothetical protein